MIQLSIIIISYNTKKILADCLNSIYDLVNDNQNEIIVVDNNSTDSTREMLQNQYPMVRTIFNKNNLGFGAANNQGIKIAKGELFLLLNSDTIASPEAIEKCKQYLNNHSDVGVLGCRLETLSGHLQLSCGRFFTLYHTIFGGIELNRILRKIGVSRIPTFGHILSENEHKVIKDVDWITGAFMFFRREVFEITSGFDERFFLYGEEHEWCFRIKNMGWRIIYYPDVKIVHIGKASGSSFSKIERNKRILQGEYYFFRKHYGRTCGFVFKNMIFQLSFLKVFLWLVFYVISGFNPYIKDKIIFQISILNWYFSKI